MLHPQIPNNEEERLALLDSYSIIDSFIEIEYDNITAIASEICHTPISLVSLIDDKKQWFKSHHGLEITETPKEFSFCAHAINDPQNSFVVNDTREDKRFFDNPLVIGDPHVKFYAGIPLVGEEGLALGTLCVIDYKPNQLNASQINSLKALSNQVMSLLNLRKKKMDLEKTLLALEEKNHELERFAYIAAHDIKSPLNNITGLAHVFSAKYGSLLDEEGKQLLTYINTSSDKLKKLVDGMLGHSQNEKSIKENKSKINIQHAIKELQGLFISEGECRITIQSDLKHIVANKTALSQILINLISNAVKYNDKEISEIIIGVNETVLAYQFYVQDNGPGISVEDHDKIFKIFEVLKAKDKFGIAGNGIGLATVKKLVESLGGQISIDKSFTKGTKFIFSLGK